MMKIWPDLPPDAKVVRRLEDAILECVDNTVEVLIDAWEGEMPEVDTPEYEQVVSELADRVFNYATKGENP